MKHEPLTTMISSSFSELNGSCADPTNAPFPGTGYATRSATVMLSSVLVALFTMPGLFGASVNAMLKVSENVDGRAGRDVVTPPVNKNAANGYLNVALGTLALVVADETAAVEIAKAATPAPARMAMARAGAPKFFTAGSPPWPPR